jgi:putative addiction module killer protein
VAKTVRIYETANGRRPFARWLSGLRDATTKARILRRLERLEEGHYGDVAPVGDGISELRLFFGPGYRIYFYEDGEQLIVLLTAGDKGSQTRDIAKAKAYLKDYLARGE